MIGISVQGYVENLSTGVCLEPVRSCAVNPQAFVFDKMVEVLGEDFLKKDFRDEEEVLAGL